MSQFSVSRWIQRIRGNESPFSHFTEMGRHRRRGSPPETRRGSQDNREGRRGTDFLRLGENESAEVRRVRSTQDRTAGAVPVRESEGGYRDSEPRFFFQDQKRGDDFWLSAVCY